MQMSSVFKERALVCFALTVSETPKFVTPVPTPQLSPLIVMHWPPNSGVDNVVTIAWNE